MVRPAVIALTVVLHRQLPIARLDQVVLIGNLGLAQIVRLQIGAHHPAELVEVLGRIFGEADEEQAFERADMDRLQTVAGLVEALAHMLGMDQLAGRVIDPGMIAADEIADRRLFLVDEARAAMAADIVKGADLAIVVAQNGDRIGADIDDHHVARLRHVRLDADEQPMAAENDLHIGLEDRRIRVERRLERMALAAVGELSDEIDHDGTLIWPVGRAPAAPFAFSLTSAATPCRGIGRATSRF